VINRALLIPTIPKPRRLSSAFPYPLPWYLIPANIYLMIRLAVSTIFGPRLNSINKGRQELGIKGLLPMFEPFCERAKHHLCPALPELDLPFVISDIITGCGPILLPTAPVSASDPELAAWLQEGSVVLINLGTHSLIDSAVALEMATGVRALLSRHPDIRILWKLTVKGEGGDEYRQILDAELASGRVRIQHWLTADPVSILQSGQVVCSVHHGGANTFYEACRYNFLCPFS
jgi:hypothetical protein